jgi:hypothetical protein
MKWYNLVLIPFWCLFFTACKKNGDSDVLTKPVTATSPKGPVLHTLYYTDLTIQMDLKVYTNGIEIADPLIKKKFIGADSILFVQTYSPKDSVGTSIVFPKPDTALLFNSDTKFIVSYPGSQVLFTSTVTTEIQSINDILYNIVKYHPPYTFSVSTIPTGIYYAPELRVAYGGYNGLSMSLLRYKWVHTTGVKPPYTAIIDTYTGTFFNDFNPMVLNQVTAKDTLAVKVYNIILKARE